MSAPLENSIESKEYVNWGVSRTPVKPGHAYLEGPRRCVCGRSVPQGQFIIRTCNHWYCNKCAMGVKE